MGQATGLGRFLRWWGGELRSCVPGFVRRLFIPHTARLICVFSDTQITVVSERGRKRGHALLSIGRAGDAEARLRQGLTKLTSGRRRSALGLRIPSSWCLERRLDLPRAARDDAARILMSDLERSTPLGGGRSFVGVLIDQDSKSPERIVARQFVVLRERVDPLIDLVEDAGAKPEFVDIYDDATGKVHPINLLASTNASPQRSRQLRWAVATGAAAVVGAGIIANAVLGRQQEALARLQQAAAEVKPKALAVRRKLDALSDKRTRQEKLALRKSAPSASMLWAELTRTLPDTAWLESLRIERGSLEIVGYAASASELVATFEKSPLFNDAALSSPVMRDDRAGAEHFGIRLSFEPIAGSAGTTSP